MLESFDVGANRSFQKGRAAHVPFARMMLNGVSQVIQKLGAAKGSGEMAKY